MHNIQNETGWHSWSPCLHARITGVEHHTWFIQGWGSNPGHTACQPLNRLSCSPSPNVCILYKVSLHNPGQPRTCYVDMVADLELMKTWLSLPSFTPIAYQFCINLCVFHSIQCSSFYSDSYYLYTVLRILWFICLTLWQSVTNSSK